MTTRVLYLGDTSLQAAAAYLAGMMHAWGWSWEYVASDTPLRASHLRHRSEVIVLSDYPAAGIADDLQHRLVDAVADGTGLVMIGGWESFHGAGGNWDGTPVAGVLPVHIGDRDDRVNFDQPALARSAADHPLLRNLPWESRPPCIGGLNRLSPRADAEVLLEAEAFRASLTDGTIRFIADTRYPLLVVGSHGGGRTAALATDVAPHWVGGLVDWGRSRLKSQAPGAEAIEVGGDYARFFRQLLAWAAGKE